MKRAGFLAVLCTAGLLMLPCAASAQLVQLADEQLGEVVGQAGIAFDQHYDNVSGMGGLLNYSDVTLVGSVEVRNQTEVPQDLVSQMAMPGFSMFGLGLMGLRSMGIGTHAIDMTINIDQLTIGAIRVGNDTTGPELGSLSIYGLRADIKGTVTIWND
ncbi:MAG TPA: hypothetical protein PLS81_08190 [Deltaproteobacteria bacterium]|nr:hypothetical protein [Deltaproteobacteria bacterium]HOM29423.1 hypothetical protein [Deltaproteobacteria bacterium]HPP80981.1 hypothetical protein [Deltaproteobacteria bacterium]